MKLQSPVPFDEAVQRFDRRSPVASAMRTEDWARVPLEIREAAFFSAAVEEERTLHSMKRRIADDLSLNPEVRFNGKSGFVADMRRTLGTAPGDSGKLTDLTSRRRLELIYEMNVEEAYEFGRNKTAQEPALLEAFPARELIRVESREVPRSWRERWTAAGGKLYGGRMIALVNDPVWANISRFGRPYPPFDFGSGMGMASMERDEAEALGVIAPGELPPAEDPQFNAVRQASVRGLPKDAVARLAEIFGPSFRQEGQLAAVSTVDTGELFERAQNRGETFSSAAYENVTPAQAAAMAEVTGGMDLSKYRHSLDSSSINHTINNHGDPKREAARGQVAITKKDFERLPRLMRNVTEVRLAETSKTGLERLEFIARDPDNAGDFVVIEEVRSPKKGFLNLVTMRHHKGRAPHALDNQPFSLTSETIPDPE